MAIDLSREHLISLTETTRILPRRRAGKKPHVSCIYRWTTSGDTPDSPKVRSVTQRERATAKALRELEAAGV